MFLFTELAKKLECDGVIESGGRLGGSTSFIAAALQLPLVSIGSDPFELPGVTFIKGDSRSLLAGQIRKSASQRIAILIDGPKGQDAVDLALKALQSEKVKFVAVHDLTPDQAAPGQFHSHKEAFRKEYGFLDDSVGEYLGKYPAGPGLTVFSNEPL